MCPDRTLSIEQERVPRLNHDLAAAKTFGPPAVRGQAGAFQSPKVLASELLLKAAASPAEV